VEFLKSPAGPAGKNIGAIFLSSVCFLPDDDIALLEDVLCET
jgi:hypothetical protein